MARPSRRDEVLEAALGLFVARGFEGATIASIAAEVGVTKAAVSYHFPCKEDLLDALATPLLDALDAAVPSMGTEPPAWPGGVRDLVTTYVDILLTDGDLAVWLDGDRALLETPVGARLRRNHQRTRRALVGRTPDTRSRIAASIALGALWRPVRNLDHAAVSRHRDLLIESALAPLRVLREDRDRVHDTA